MTHCTAAVNSTTTTTTTTTTITITYYYYYYYYYYYFFIIIISIIIIFNRRSHKNGGNWISEISIDSELRISTFLLQEQIQLGDLARKTNLHANTPWNVRNGHKNYSSIYRLVNAPLNVIALNRCIGRHRIIDAGKEKQFPIGSR